MPRRIKIVFVASVPLVVFLALYVVKPVSAADTLEALAVIVGTYVLGAGAVMISRPAWRHHAILWLDRAQAALAASNVKEARRCADEAAQLLGGDRAARSLRYSAGLDDTAFAKALHDCSDTYLPLADDAQRRCRRPFRWLSVILLILMLARIAVIWWPGSPP
jgi:hypothetical protein